MDRASFEKYLTPATVIGLVENYFPQNSANNFAPICEGCYNNSCADGKLFEHGEQLLAEMKHQFRMFGTSDELAENLLKYRIFTSSLTTFGNDFCVPYSTSPVLYDNHTEKKTFIHRKDVFVYLQNMFSHFCIMKNPVPRAIVAFFLKSFSAKLDDDCKMEFVPWKKDFYFSLYDQFKREYNLKLVEGHRSEFKAPESFEEYLEIVKKLVMRDNFNEQNFSTIKILLRDAYGNGCPEEIRRIKTYISVCTALKKIIVANEFHLSSSEQSAEKKCPRALRLFVDGNNKFVMDLEMELIEKGRSESLLGEVHQLTTSNEKVAMDFVAKHPDVKLLITPIVRTPLRAVPYPDMFKNGFSVLATDFVLETITDLTFGWKAFQNCQGEQWTAVESLVTYLEEAMYLDHLEPYFENSNRDDVIRECEKLFPTIKEPATLKTCHSDGYCLNLEGQLKYLELDLTFPNILEIAKKFQLQKQCRQVSDIIDAIIQLVRVCFLEKFPIIARFIHQQKACEEVLFCKLCEKKQKTKHKKKAKKAKAKQQEVSDDSASSALQPVQEEVAETPAVHTKPEDVQSQDLKQENISPQPESPIAKTVSLNGTKSAEVQRQEAKSFWGFGDKSQELLKAESSKHDVLERQYSLSESSRSEDSDSEQVDMISESSTYQSTTSQEVLEPPKPERRIAKAVGRNDSKSANVQICGDKSQDSLASECQVPLSRSEDLIHAEPDTVQAEMLSESTTPQEVSKPPESSGCSVDSISEQLAEVVITEKDQSPLVVCVKLSKTPAQGSSSSSASSSSPAQKENYRNEKQLSKKDHPRILQRMPITDNSPESNICRKCLSASNHCMAKNDELQESQRKVKELERKVAKLEETVDEQKILEREKEYEAEIAKLREDLKETRGREEKLKNEKALILTEKGRKQKNHEDEKKTANKKIEKLQQRLQEEQTALSNSKRAISTLEDKLRHLELQSASDLRESEARLSNAIAEAQWLKEKWDEAELLLQMSSETRLLYLTLKEINVTIQLEQPLEAVEKQAEQIINYAKEKKARRAAQYELDIYKKQFQEYQNELTSRIQILMNNPSSPASDIAAMPDAPKLSNMFLMAYERVVKDGRE